MNKETNLSEQKATPLYQRIKAHIKEKIEKGDFIPDMKIPSETELGLEFDASRMTVNRAIRELTAEGILKRRQGVGTFVKKPKSVPALLEVGSIADEITRRGGDHSCFVHHLGEEKASPELADTMELPPYSPVFHSIIVHMDEGIPIQVADRYVRPDFAPLYLEQDFSRTTPNSYLLSLSPVSKVEHIVEALIPHAWIRKLLEINGSEPCLCLQRTTWVEETIVTRSSFYYPGTRFRLGGTFTTMDNGAIMVS